MILKYGEVLVKVYRRFGVIEKFKYSCMRYFLGFREVYIEYFILLRFNFYIVF